MCYTTILQPEATLPISLVLEKPCNEGIVPGIDSLVLIAHLILGGRLKRSVVKSS